ncbi:MAG: outer membrane protein assembly factor, partial [Nostoc sp. CreGUA01]
MKISTTAIFTLATLAAGNVTGQATAASAKVATPDVKTDNLVVPVIEETPARVETIASPETIVAQQFSQNPLLAPTTANKNSTIILKPAATLTQNQKDNANSSVKPLLIPSSPSSPSSP